MEPFCPHFPMSLLGVLLSSPIALPAALATDEASAVAAPETTSPVETLTASTRKVVARSWRETASAQVGQGAFDPEPGQPGAWRHRFEVEGRTIDLLLRETGERSEAGQALREIWVDADGDGRESEPEVFALEIRNDGVERSRVSLHSVGLPLELTLYEWAGEQRVTVMTQYHFEADVDVAGEPHRLVILDMNLDGQASPGDTWVALDSQRVLHSSLPSLLFSAIDWEEPWYVGEQVLEMASAEDGELELTLRPQDRPAHEFLAERAARKQAEINESFDEDRDSFLAAFEIDPERPVDPAPPRWHHARNMEEALAYAQSVGRPLYVEFGSDGCGWCKRYGWLNYQDAEITERLRRFALVKINRDLDPDQTAPRLGMEGVPAHALFNEDGEALRTFSGWTAPRHHAEELDATWEDWVAEQAKR